MANRIPWVGGNWKCNGDAALIESLAAQFAADGAPRAAEVCFFPTALHLEKARAAFGARAAVGVQNVCAHGKGAFTGEVAAEMAEALGARWALVGHSERRSLFGETDEQVVQKYEQAAAAGLRVAVCFGETLAQREAGASRDVCEAQLRPVLPAIKCWDSTVLAYEPVWAIGTGKRAALSDVAEMLKFVRDYVRQHAGVAAADKVRIVYGGSVTAANCKELAGAPDLDGFLVGGASLKSEFLTIVHALDK
uniref:Triosephosphate isomerase n=1 Tax=Dermatophagoides pteronyssinus TaxID=6956 RepID=A0A6P6Y189_DERPT|nr:triosephosphate isomerase, cytosolic-like [Dermatophagoides pteronyssinus]